VEALLPSHEQNRSVAATPNLDSHVFWSERAVGLRCEATHRLIDSYASILGSHHRIYFHDPMSAMFVADQADGPQCRAAALNHIAVDEAYGVPETKIMMEMVRLTETVPQEPIIPGAYGGGGSLPDYQRHTYPSNYGRCRVRHFNR
jgi:hypothetical protein